MGLKKNGCLPTARMQMYYLTAKFRDLAVLDYSTRGHALFNYGHLAWTSPVPQPENLFSVQVGETDLVTGDSKKLFQCVDEILAKGYRHIFLMPSAISEVMGIDLEGCAAEIAERTDADVFAVKAKLNADYYEGAEKLYAALAKKIPAPCEKKRGTYNILGGLRYADEINHAYIAKLMERLSMTCNADVHTAASLESLKSLPCAELNLVTSGFALRAAKQLQREYGTPYLYFNPFSPAEENRLLAEAAALTEREYTAPCSDGIYEALSAQLRNILAVTKPQIVCYTDTDRLFALEGFFGELGFTAEYFCSHKKGKYPYAEPDEVISSCRDKMVLTYDSLCRKLPRALAVDESGLEYKIHLPLQDYTIGKDGAYRLIKLLGEALLQ